MAYLFLVPPALHAQLGINHLLTGNHDVYSVVARVPPELKNIVSVRFSKTSAGIPQRVIFLDGIMPLGSTTIPPTQILDGNPISSQTVPVEVKSGFLTLIPLELWDDKYTTTNRVSATPTLNGLEIRYEDTPGSSGDTPGSKRDDLEINIAGVGAIDNKDNLLVPAPSDDNLGR
jgi:hypothetical protein